MERTARESALSMKVETLDGSDIENQGDEMIEGGLFFSSECGGFPIVSADTPRLEPTVPNPYLNSHAVVQELPHWHFRTAFPAWPIRLTVTPISSSTSPPPYPPTESQSRAMLLAYNEYVGLEHTRRAELSTDADEEALDAASRHQRGNGSLWDGEGTIRWLKCLDWLSLKARLRDFISDMEERDATRTDLIAKSQSPSFRCVGLEHGPPRKRARLEAARSRSLAIVASSAGKNKLSRCCMRTTARSAPLVRDYQAVFPERTAAPAENHFCLGATEVRDTIRRRPGGMDEYFQARCPAPVCSEPLYGSTSSTLDTVLSFDFDFDFVELDDNEPALNFAKLPIRKPNLVTGLRSADFYKNWDRNGETRRIRFEATGASRHALNRRSPGPGGWNLARPKTPSPDSDDGSEYDTPSESRENSFQCDANSPPLRRQRGQFDLRRAMQLQEPVEEGNQQQTSIVMENSDVNGERHAQWCVYL